MHNEGDKLCVVQDVDDVMAKLRIRVGQTDATVNYVRFHGKYGKQGHDHFNDTYTDSFWKFTRERLQRRSGSGADEAQ